MDTQTFEQLALTADHLGENLKYITENMTIVVQVYEGSILGIEVPNFVDLKVVETAPGARGEILFLGGPPNQQPWRREQQFKFPYS